MKQVGYVIAIILFIVVAGEVAYVFISDNDSSNVIQNNNSSNEGTIEDDTTDDVDVVEDVESSITLNNTYMENDLIIEEYTLVINGVSKTINVEFSLEIEEQEDYYSTFYIRGMMDGKEVYVFSRYVEEVDYNDCFTIDYLSSVFNESSFEFITGSDDVDYLLIYYDYAYAEVHGGRKLLIFNEDFDVLNDEDMLIYGGTTGYVTVDDDAVYYGYEEDYGYISIKIENNKIYWLRPNMVDCETGSLEARIYTISNDTLSYEVGITYEIIYSAGAC